MAANTIALTGKAIGSTNVVVLNSDGVVLTELQIHVEGHKPGSVTVRRALQTSRYACTGTTCRYDGDGPESAAAAD